MSFKSGVGSRRQGHALRSRSPPPALDGEGSVVVDEGQESCWASMPPELLRDVLMRVEAEESSWPARKDVVACAGVCKSWRGVLKEIVMTPEVSGRLTLPISVKQPGPRNFPFQCFIRRNRTTRTYHLYLGLTQALTDNGKFLLAARKYRRPACTEYIMSLNADDMSKESGTYVGKLRSNFFGTRFIVYDAQPPPRSGVTISRSHSTRLVGSKQVAPRVPAGNYPVVHIAYELNVLGSRGPRRIQCIMDSIPASAVEPGGTAPTPTDLSFRNLDSLPSMPFSGSKSSWTENLSGSLSAEEEMLVLKNKSPRWHDQLQCWCLNFRGRVTVASVKNFQLVASGSAGQEHEMVLLQFGKVGKDLFTMDYQYPISAFQAFGICLSSFDTKLACE